MRYAAVILAAGFSSRMGEFKPLMRLCGENLLSRCAGVFKSCGISDVIVVTGHRHVEVEKEAGNLGIGFVFNPDFGSGMYSSICCGVKAVSGVDGFFLLPVDIPLVRAATLTALQEQFNGGEVLIPCFDGDRGHPPLIPFDYVDRIREYGGDGGLRKLLELFPRRDIEGWDSSILKDVDTRQDFSDLETYCLQMKTGTAREAFLLASMMMPEKGVRHGLMVASAADAIGEELNRNGYDLNRAVIYNSALLHDIAKGCPDHEHEGAALLTSLGLGDLAECVGNHRDVESCLLQRLTEVEVVFLADKLVSGDRPVTVNSRYEEKLTLYSGDPESCRAIRRRMKNGIRVKELVERQCGKTLNQILGQRCNEYRPSV